MLRIYDVMLGFVGEMRPTIDSIARHDPGLADQMRRALQSVVLNTAEGSGSRGRNRQARYHSALGSIREARSCVDVAAVFGYIAPPSQDTLHRFDHITGTLVKLVA